MAGLFLSPAGTAYAQVVAPAPAVAAAKDVVPPAADILTGQWQGTLPKKKVRLVFLMAPADRGWSAKMYIIDRSGQPYNASSVTLDGDHLTCSMEVIGMTYQGTMGADGNLIVGSWTQGANAQPLTLVRAEGKAAWKIPAPPKPAKLMEADAAVSFHKATIKANNAAPGGPYGFRYDGRNFTTLDTSVADLISYAYEVQAKQIDGIPDWIDKDHYDIAMTLDQKGLPDHQQLRVVVKKLLAERFQLVFHAGKTEMPAYVLTVAKDGQKLTPTQFQSPLPGMSMLPESDGLHISVWNATMEDIAIYLQLMILDRPVVALTGLTGRFDLQFTFTPDDSQLSGHPPKLPAATATTVPAPDLFEALRRKLGLELTPQDTFVDVIVVDHVEKPR